MLLRSPGGPTSCFLCRHTPFHGPDPPPHPHAVGLPPPSTPPSHLVLPLGGHDLRIHAADVDAGKQARLVVHVRDVAADGVAGARRAVVGALGRGVAVVGPAQGPLGQGVEQGVLLLNAKPAGRSGGGGGVGQVAAGVGYRCMQWDLLQRCEARCRAGRCLPFSHSRGA